MELIIFLLLLIFPKCTSGSGFGIFMKHAFAIARKYRKPIELICSLPADVLKTGHIKAQLSEDLR